MINKLIFLYHGNTRTVPGSIPSTGSSTPGLIAVGLLILLAIALWIYFTRKRGIMEWGEKMKKQINKCSECKCEFKGANSKNKCDKCGCKVNSNKYGCCK